MSGQLQLRRGTTAQNNAFTGAVGELTYNTDDGGLISHDGVTAGGYPGGGYLYAPGAVVTTVQAKLQETISVKDFGAVGDGVTNDTPAFTLAIAAAAGKKLKVPSGVYRLVYTPPSAFRTPANICIEGDGIGVTSLVFASTSSAFANLFTMENDGLTIRNLSISVVEVPTQLYGVINWSRNRLTLDSCDFNGNATATGAVLNSLPFLTISPASGTQTDLIVKSCSIHGFDEVFLKSNVAASTQRRLSICNNNFYANYASDISINSPLGECSQIEIIGNTLHDPVGTAVNPYQLGIAIASCSDVVISGNTITGAYGAGVTALGGVGAIHIEENANAISVTGNTISVSATNVAGIFILSNNISGTRYFPSNVTITGNTIRQTGSAMAAGTVGINIPLSSNVEGNNIVINGNTISNFQYGYLALSSAVQNIAFQSNLIDSCEYGIRSREYGLNLTDNQTANCTVGINTTGGGVVIAQGHTFSNCTTNLSGAGTRPIVLVNPSFVFSAATYAAGTNTYLVLTTANTNDRLHGLISSVAWTSDNASDTVVNEYECTWDGTTFTNALKISYSPGVFSVTPEKNATNFVLNLFTAATRTSTRVTAKMNGTISCLV